MGLLPRLTTSELDAARHRLSTRGHEKDNTVILDGANTDAGNTPAFRFRAGNVVVLDTSESNYVEANDVGGDASSGAIVSAAETADVDWQNAVMTFTMNGVVITIITLGAGDDTDAEVVIAYNADGAFVAAGLFADESGGVVRVRLLQPGTDVLLINSDLVSAYGAAGTEDEGENADYRVTESTVDLQDINGVAIDEEVAVSFLGDYDESALINLTGDAKRVLLERGSSFA